MLCDDLEGWDGGGGKEVQEGGDVPLKSEGAGSLCSGRGPSPAGWAPAGPREARQGTGITFLR